MTTTAVEPLSAPLPHPPRRVPLIGDVLGVSAKTPVQDSTRLSATLGPIFERTVMGTRAIIVSGADLAGELCDDSRFAKHVSPAISSLRVIAGDGLFTARNDEPNWAKAHALLAPAFTRSSMQSYHSAMLDVTDELDTWWRSSGTGVDVSADMTSLTLDTIGRTAMGYSFGGFGVSAKHPFVRAMVRALTFSQRSGSVSESRLGTLIVSRGARRYRADSAVLHDVVRDVIRTRRAAPEPHPEDLLELMLRAAQDNPELAIDDENVRNQLVTFLVAGHETTSGALSFALYYLSRHPEVLARAREEVDAVWKGDTHPEFEQVAKLRYVRRVVDETLRLWPTAPAFAREARQDTVIGGRYAMKKGEWVFVLLPGIHRDPVWGPDPQRFDPDRFEPAAVRGRPAHVYKPFGTGERACIGRQFAVHEAILVLGRILQSFDLRGDPDYELRVTERLTLMPTDFRLDVTPRSIAGPRPSWGGTRTPTRSAWRA